MRASGCVVLLAAVAILLVVALGRVLLWVILGASAILITLEAIGRSHRRALTRQFHHQFGPPKDLLLVYTASPHWLPRIEREWLPRWGERAVLLNRSEPWSAKQVEARIWKTFGGYVEHTPLAVVLPRVGRPVVVRFFLAFRDFKHGKAARLLRAEQQLSEALTAADRSDASTNPG